MVAFTQFLPKTRQSFLWCFGLLLIIQGETGIKSKTHFHIPYKSGERKCAQLEQDELPVKKSVDNAFQGRDERGHMPRPRGDRAQSNPHFARETRVATNGLLQKEKRTVGTFVFLEQVITSTLLQFNYVYPNCS